MRLEQPRAFSAPDTHPPTAVFVDAENLSPAHAGRILMAVGGRQAAGVVRAYGDMARGVWAGTSGFRLVHSGGGKNAADMLICIEAVAAWHTGRYRRIAIATSDRDFSHLALWLRDAGAEVLGLGCAKAPAALRHACSCWVALEAPAPADPDIKAPTPLEVAALHAVAQAGGCIRLAALGSVLGRSGHRTALTEKTWRGFVTARPSLFSMDPVGPDACVRLAQTRSTVTRSLA